MTKTKRILRWSAGCCAEALLAMLLAGPGSSIAGTETLCADDTASMAECPACSNLASPVRSNYVNLTVHANDGVEQAEISVAINPVDQQRLLVGYMTDRCGTYLARLLGYAGSPDAGASWVGADTLPGSGTADPVVAYDADGNAYYCHLRNLSLYVSKSPDGGTYWPLNQIFLISSAGESNPDKPHFAVDLVSPSYRNHIYCAWSSNGWPLNPHTYHYGIAFKRSTNGGESWGTSRSLTQELGDSVAFCQGVNLAIAPDGAIYAAYSVYNKYPSITDSLYTEDAIGFNRSDNSGVDWIGARKIINVQGIRKAQSEFLPPCPVSDKFGQKS
ncbi:MAG: PH domain-containing protein [Candidatus Zixiibacteriota bacterium]